jgi:hypothetical protein
MYIKAVFNEAGGDLLNLRFRGALLHYDKHSVF